MGRDTSIVTHHEKCTSSEDIRCIVAGDSVIKPVKGVIGFDLKPNKVHVFSKKDEKVIYEEQ